jgi:hypothetical protein
LDLLHRLEALPVLQPGLSRVEDLPEGAEGQDSDIVNLFYFVFVTFHGVNVVPGEGEGGGH